MKVAVIGYSGAGKSTVARALGKRYQCPVLHMDRVHHAPGWQVRDRGEAHRIVQEFMEQPSWIIDGNYTKFDYGRRMAEADKIVFLDLPRHICFYRAVKRFVHYRGRTREDMAEGCTEKMDLEFIWWLLWKGRGSQKRKWFEAGLGKYSEKMIILKSQKEIDRYLEGLSC